MDGTVDVSEKDRSFRRATAQCVLVASERTVRAIRENDLPKSDPLPTARAAGLLAAKRTPDLLPHCHPISLTEVTFDFEFGTDSVTVRCRVSVCERTGPEMEALCGASTAALTLYDMIKGVCRGAHIERTMVLEKEGGKSGHWRREGENS